MKLTCIVISATEPVKFNKEKASISPVLKFWFCKVELDTQPFVVVKERGVATKGDPFLLALIAAPVPASLYPNIILAVHGVFALHALKEPVSVV